jgi:uncharacterized protein (DUF302 family)
MSVSAREGFVTRACRHSLEETLKRLEEMLHASGVTIFAIVDHSGEAEKVGLTMRPTKLLIFGHPKAGTPLMVASPSVAIDLPLKILLWEDGDGRAWLAYNAPTYLRDRHDLPGALLENIAAVEVLASRASGGSGEP